MAEQPTMPPLPEGYERLPSLPYGYERVETRAPSVLESVARGAAEGATFGFDDKLGMDKTRREASRKANPWAHFFGELVGGAAPMVAATLLPTGVGQAAAGARGANLATKAAGLVRSALVPGEIASVGQAVGQGAKLGTVYGALSGAGHADVKDTDAYTDALLKRGTGAVQGAVMGAAIGVPMGAAGHGVYRGAQEVGTLLSRAGAETAPGGRGALVTATRKLEQDRITPQTIIDNIRAEFPDDTTAGGGLAKRFWGPGNVPAAQRGVWTADMVEDIVRGAAAGDSAADISSALATKLGGKGPGPDAVQTMLDELAARHLGPLNLVDRAAMVRPGSGENTQMSMRAIAATPGEATANARETLLERALGAQERLRGLIERSVGSPDLAAGLAQHKERFKDAATQLYGPAFAEQKPFDLMPLFKATEAQFDRMRGVIPDTIRARLKDMMWTETNAAGQTMRTPPQDLQSFMYAREGLRDLIDELPKGNNLRRHLSKFYNDMTDVVAADNPKWKLANDFYQEGAAADKAVDLGRKLATRQGDASREALTALAQADKDSKAAKTALGKARGAYDKAREAGTLTPKLEADLAYAKNYFNAVDARQQLMRTAYAQNLMDGIANQGDTHDLVRKMLMPGSRNIINKVLGDEAPAFINGLKAEAAMHRTYKAQFGSQTTPLVEAVKEHTWAPRVEAGVHMLNPLTWLNPALRLAQEYGARTINNRRNTELMRLYTDPDQLRQIEALRAMQALYTMRSNAGNAAGKPVVGLGAGVLPGATVGDQTGVATSSDYIDALGRLNVGIPRRP